MPSDDVTARAARAAAALALADLCQQRGWELEVAGTSGLYVLVRRPSPTAMHVIYGEPAQVLEAVTAADAPITGTGVITGAGRPADPLQPDSGA